MQKSVRQNMAGFFADKGKAGGGGGSEAKESPKAPCQPTNRFSHLGALTRHIIPLGLTQQRTGGKRLRDGDRGAPPPTCGEPAPKVEPKGEGWEGREKKKNQEGKRTCPKNTRVPIETPGPEIRGAGRRMRLPAVTGPLSSP